MYLLKILEITLRGNRQPWLIYGSKASTTQNKNKMRKKKKEDKENGRKHV